MGQYTLLARNSIDGSGKEGKTKTDPCGMPFSGVRGGDTTLRSRKLNRPLDIKLCKNIGTCSFKFQWTWVRRIPITTSSHEVTIIPFTKRAGINVLVYLTDIRRKRTNTTVEVKLFKWMTFGLQGSSLCSSAEAFKGDKICLSRLQSEISQSIASRHSFVNHGTETRRGLVDNRGIDCSEFLRTIYVNSSATEYTLGKEASMMLTRCQKRDQSACSMTHFGSRSSWRTADCREREENCHSRRDHHVSFTWSELR
jgi:hypothetical protein